MNIKIINLGTMEILSVDPVELHERGMPDGFIVADNITTDEWIEIIKKNKEN